MSELRLLREAVLISVSRTASWRRQSAAHGGSFSASFARSVEAPALTVLGSFAPRYFSSTAPAVVLALSLVRIASDSNPLHRPFSEGLRRSAIREPAQLREWIPVIVSGDPGTRAARRGKKRGRPGDPGSEEGGPRQIKVRRLSRSEGVARASPKEGNAPARIAVPTRIESRIRKSSKCLLILLPPDQKVGGSSPSVSRFRALTRGDEHHKQVCATADSEL